MPLLTTRTTLAASLLLLLRPALQACQCGVPPLNVAVERSEYVFLGVVTAIDEVSVTMAPDASHTYSGRVPRVSFRVGRRWKGAPTQSLSVIANSNCAYRFELGRSYLVFAEPALFAKGQLEATRCLPNAPRINSADNIRLLGPPLSP